MFYFKKPWLKDWDSKSLLPAHLRAPTWAMSKWLSCWTDTKRIQKIYTQIYLIDPKPPLDINISIWSACRKFAKKTTTQKQNKTESISKFCKTSILWHTDIISSVWLADWFRRAILEPQSRWIWGQIGVLVTLAAL